MLKKLLILSLFFSSCMHMQPARSEINPKYLWLAGAAVSGYATKSFAEDFFRVKNYTSEDFCKDLDKNDSNPKEKENIAGKILALALVYPALKLTGLIIAAHATVAAGTACAYCLYKSCQ